MTPGIGDELGDGLLDKGVIQQRQRNVFRHVEAHVAAVGGFALNFDRRLQQLAHIAPFLRRPDHSAFEPIHVEKVVHDAIEAAGAVANFGGELLEHFGVVHVWRESHELLTGRSNRGERRL